MPREFTPYLYQRDCLDALELARAEGRIKALVVMATGLGKTVVSAFEIKRLLKKAPGRVLYLCHNNDILRQSRKTYEAILGKDYTYGYFHGTEKHMHHVDVLFASFKTMVTWREVFMRDEFKYVVVDEFHHAQAATFRPTVEYFQPEFMLGLTATPERGDGLDVTELLGKPVHNMGLFKALARRLLCHVDYRVMTDEIQNIGVLDTPVGKLSIAELNRSIFIPKRDEEIARIIGSKMAEVKNPRAMIFCKTIAHAERMAALMPHAVVVHSKLKGNLKDERLNAFRNGEVSTILTVDMLNEGIDVPEANVIVFLRTTSSRTVWLQQLGRGLRKAKAKLKVLVLDFVANCERFEMIDQLQQGVRKELEALSAESVGDGTRSRPAFELTLDGVEFDERYWRLFEAIRSVREGLSEEVLIGQLRQLATSLGKTPTIRDVNEACRQGNCADASTFWDYFHGFNNALKAAGLKVNKVAAYSREELIEQLQTAATLLGRTPSEELLNNLSAQGGFANGTTFRKHFGSFPDALRAGQLALNRGGITRQLLIEQLQTLGSELGRTPKKTDIEAACKQRKIASATSISDEFGNLATALEAAGFKPTQKRGWTDEEVLEQLQALTKKLGRLPGYNDVVVARKGGECVGHGTINRRFTNLTNALRAARLLD